MISDVFCKIINGELKADVVWQNDEFLVIKDLHPQAPVHLLILPKKHFTDLNDFKDDAALLGRAMLVVNIVAEQVGLDGNGYRLIINEGDHGGKLVPHFHIHLLGGKRLGPKIVQ